jgi:MFS family permease
MTLNSPTDVRSAGATGNAEAPEPEILAHPVEEMKGPWWRHLTAYHWFVFFIASAAWFFDCLDQRIFSLARNPALNSLKALGTSEKDVQDFGKIVTACFLIGWGIGGLTFGSLGDKFGRAKMLTTSILIYSAFTGLSYFSQSWWDFTIFRFLTGVGVGGVFGLAVALIAETVPASARTQTLGLLQVLSTIGNITAGLVQIAAESLKEHGVTDFWRYMFLVGAAPALMVIFTARWLKEPEPWLKLKAEGKLPKGSIFSPYGKLFREKRWRKNLIVGALIASTGVVGLWAIGEYAVDLQRQLFKRYYEKEVPPAAVPVAQAGQTEAQIAQEAKKAVEARQIIIVDKEKNAIFWTYICNMVGAGVGMWLFTRLAGVAGRRLAFAVGFIAALVITAAVYWKMETPIQAYWMMFLMGAAQLSVFAGFAIYLPELFPSSLRSTGTSFCYNLGRFAAAGGSFFSAYLSGAMVETVAGGDKTSLLPLRYSAIIMCGIFLVGLLTLPFAPETRGKPLPQE